MEYFKTRTPHSVKKTVNLNGTRDLIAELTKPMAEISQAIKTTIKICEEQTAELQTTRLSGDLLRQRLQLQRVQLVAEPLAMPRTVCRNINCIEVKDDGNTDNKTVTIYKTHCHKQC